MGQVAEKTSTGEEFWRPPTTVAAKALTEMAGRCAGCGAELVAGARFCHLCGAARGARSVEVRQAWSRFWNGRLRSALGLPLGPMIAFLSGVVCVLMALATGIVYSASTLVDWQAVQLWRLEWLLAAVAAFLAGILLKRSEA